MSNQRTRASGVQELVERLRQDGVSEGQEQAARLLEAARREASEIVDLARRKAVEIREEAELASTRLRKAGEQALELAVRDALLRLRTEIEDRFAAQLARLVSERLQDRDFIEKLLLNIAGAAVPRDRPVEIVMPDTFGSAVPDGPIGRPGGDVDNFVLCLTGDMLREGVTVSVSDEVEAGLIVRVADEGLEVRLDERALRELLRENLLPRFRELLDRGVMEAEGPDGNE
jgi:V/A-type H+-transporting ATPase subunit E